MAGIGAAFKRLGEQEDETPERDGDDEDVVEVAEEFVVVEDAAVEEEDAELDAAVGEFFNYQDRAVNLEAVFGSVKSFLGLQRETHTLPWFATRQSTVGSPSLPSSPFVAAI